MLAPEIRQVCSSVLGELCKPLNGQSLYAVRSSRQGLQAWKHFGTLHAVISSLLKRDTQHPKQEILAANHPFTRYMTDTLQLPVI